MSSHDVLRISLALADLVGKSCIVLVLAWAVTRGLRFQSASTRHFVWLCGFGMLLILPVLTVTLPGKDFPVVRDIRLPQRFVESSATPLVAPALDLGDSQSSPTAAKEVQREQNFRSASNVLAAMPKPRQTMIWMDLFDGLVGLWGAGLGLVLLRGLQGLLSINRVRAHFTRSHPRSEEVSLIRLAERVGVRRRWELRLSTSSVPPAAMTWGVIRPVVLMPKDSESWSQERLEAVLLHELAHVRRYDSMSQLIALVAGALYWFNPLVWLCARAMRAEAESAADDTVLCMGIKPSDYASELLRIAAELGQRQQPYSHIGVSVMKKSKIESRVKAILDPSARRRRGVTQLEAVATIVVAGVVMIPLGALRAGVFQDLPAKVAPLAPVQVAPPTPAPSASAAKPAPTCPFPVVPASPIAPRAVPLATIPVAQQGKVKGVAHSASQLKALDLLTATRLKVLEGKLMVEQQTEKMKAEKLLSKKLRAEDEDNRGLERAKALLEKSERQGRKLQVESQLDAVKRQVQAQEKSLAEQNQLRNQLRQKVDQEILGQELRDLRSQSDNLKTGKITQEDRKRLDEAMRNFKLQAEQMHQELAKARAELDEARKEVDRQGKRLKALQMQKLPRLDSASELNPRQLLTQLASCQTNLTMAQAKLSELKHLRDKGMASDETLAQAKEEYQLALHAVHLAQLDLKKSQIK